MVASTLLVGMLLGCGISVLVRVGLRNHRRFVTAAAVDRRCVRSWWAPAA